MKSFFHFTFVISCLFVTGISSHAQTSNKNIYIPTVPEWVPAKGFWVVESNNKTPKRYTVFFYNNAKELVYKEFIEGVRLNTGSEIVKMHLKHVLSVSLLVWEKDHRTHENNKLLLNLLRKK